MRKLVLFTAIATLVIALDNKKMKNLSDCVAHEGCMTI